MSGGQPNKTGKPKKCKISSRILFVLNVSYSQGSLSYEVPSLRSFCHLNTSCLVSRAKVWSQNCLPGIMDWVYDWWPTKNVWGIGGTVYINIQLSLTICDKTSLLKFYPTLGSELFWVEIVEATSSMPSLGNSSCIPSSGNTSCLYGKNLF